MDTEIEAARIQAAATLAAAVIAASGEGWRRLGHDGESAPRIAVRVFDEVLAWMDTETR